MRNTIDHCHAVRCACAVICDPHVDRANERLWLLASLVVSCALKGRWTLWITLAINNPACHYSAYRRVFVFSIMLTELTRGCLCAPRGQWTLSVALKHPSLISRLQSYYNQSPSPRIHTHTYTQTVILFLQSKFMCPGIQFPSHPHKLELQRHSSGYICNSAINV